MLKPKCLFLNFVWPHTVLCSVLLFLYTPRLTMAQPTNDLHQPPHISKSKLFRFVHEHPVWFVARDQLRKKFPQQHSPVFTLRPHMRQLFVRSRLPSSMHWEIRFRAKDAPWQTWTPLHVTWETSVSKERVLRNGYLDAPRHTIAFQLRYIGHKQERANVHPTFLKVTQTRGWTAARLQMFAQSTISAPKSFLFTQPPLQLLGMPKDLAIRPRSAWEGSHPQRKARCAAGDSYKRRIAIHHTYTDNTSGNYAAELRGIQNGHFMRSFCDVGYHFLITRDGTIWEGRATRLKGAHALRQNPGNLGIAFVGNYGGGRPVPRAMLCSASKLLDWATERYGIPRLRALIRGHKEFGISTACPGNTLLSKLNALVQQTTAENCAGTGLSASITPSSPGSDTAMEPHSVHNIPRHPTPRQHLETHTQHLETHTQQRHAASTCSACGDRCPKHCNAKQNFGWTCNTLPQRPALFGFLFLLFLALWQCQRRGRRFRTMHKDAAQRHAPISMPNPLQKTLHRHRLPLLCTALTLGWSSIGCVRQADTPQQQQKRQTQAPQYQDVPSSHPAAEAVQWLTQKGVLKGKCDAGVCRFHPNRPLKRAEFAALLVSAFTLSKPASPRVTVTVLDNVAWAKQVIETVVAREAMSGVSNKTDAQGNITVQFDPGGTVTTEQAFAGLSSFFKNPQTAPVKQRYIYAAKASNWAIPHLQNIAPLLKNNHILFSARQGLALLLPQAPIKRGEIADLIYSILQPQRRPHLANPKEDCNSPYDDDDDGMIDESCPRSSDIPTFKVALPPPNLSLSTERQFRINLSAATRMELFRKIDDYTKTG
ncbi:MAG: N-acetylmuramoyl-L-alanine amidase [Myxococcota bacterium]